MDILATKLFMPQVTDNHVKRHELLKKKSQSMNHQLTLVCAPAGYGKTTFVLEMVANANCACAWISLDEGDNDLSRFFAYLIAALRKASLAVGSEAEYLMSDTSFNSVNVILTTIINRITAAGEKLILVLDDYHYIRSSQVNDAVKYLSENQPPNLHIVIITREDPQFPLARLRVQQRLTEVRMGDLSFSHDESAMLIQKTIDAKITSQAIQRVTERTEGWAAGIQIAGLMFKGLTEEQVDEVINRLSGSNSYIIDYLVEEVLQQQTPEVADFLRKTSVLERMNGELCDALTGKSNGRSMLHQLEKANLFLIPLDLTREWYRYHHLFADSLRIALSEEEEETLNGLAAIWMKRAGFSHEAIRYAFKSKDKQMSLKMVEDTVIEVFQNAQLETLVKWLEQLPDDLIKTSEILAVRKSIALLITGRVWEALEHLHALGPDFEKSASPHNKGLIFCVKALVAINSGHDAEQLAKDALANLQEWDPIARTSMLNTLGRSQYNKGNIVEAVVTLKGAYEAGSQMGYTFVTTLALMNYGICLNLMGRRKEAFELYTKHMEGMLAKFGKPLPFIGVVYISLAELYYENNQIEKAKLMLEEGLELCRAFSYSIVSSDATLARIDFALNNKKAALSRLTNAAQSLSNANKHGTELRALGTLVHLLLRMGKITEASQYSDQLKEGMHDSSNWANAALPYARLLIYQGARPEAKEILLALETNLIETEQQATLITVLILLAQLCAISGDTLQAGQYANRAVRLAVQNGYVRRFLDEEPLLWDLLKLPGIVWETANAVFVNALKQEREQASPGQQHRASGQYDQLSEREMEILTLVAQGMSNSDIAKALFISTNTAQWHISHIYSKLEVKSRTQAILRAKELGIL